MIRIMVEVDCVDEVVARRIQRDEFPSLDTLHEMEGVLRWRAVWTALPNQVEGGTDTTTT